MSTESITQEAAQYTGEQRRLIQDVLCKGGSETEIAFYMEVAKRTRLDPFRRQIHAIKRWDGQQKREVLTFQVSIDGLRAIASRTGAYAGSDPITYTIDEKTRLPLTATCTVYRLVQGQRYAFTSTAYYSESVQLTRDGEPNRFWRERPFGQLGKCAEAGALRKGFPEEASGLYIEEEIGGEADGAPGAHPGIVRQPMRNVTPAQPAETSAETGREPPESPPPVDQGESPPVGDNPDLAQAEGDFLEMARCWRDFQIPDGLPNGGRRLGDLSLPERQALQGTDCGAFNSVICATIYAASVAYCESHGVTFDDFLRASNRTGLVVHNVPREHWLKLAVECYNWIQTTYEDDGRPF